MQMRNLFTVSIVLFASFLAGLWEVSAVLAQSELTDETRKVLSSMDQTGKTLSDLTADVKQTKVTVVVNDTSVETGKLFFRRGKNGSRTKLDYEHPESKTLLIDKGKVLIYEPKINRLQEIELGKNRDYAEFLLIGFGQPTSSLTKTWEVRFVQEETLNDTKTSLLELKPKSDKVSAMFSKILLWVDQSHWIPIQTRLTETSGDYLIIQFDNMKINPRLSDRAFKLHVPSNVEKIKTSASDRDH